MNLLKFQNKFIYIFYLALLSCRIEGQSLNDYLKKYEGFNEVILEESQKYKIELEKGKLSVNVDFKYESLVLTDQGAKNTSEAFYYSELVPLHSFEAYTLVDRKGKYKKIPVVQINDNNYTQSHVFHSDVKSKKLTFSNLEVGSKKAYNYQTEIKDPNLITGYNFRGYDPIEKTTASIEVDKDVEIECKIFNDPFGKIKKTIEKKGNKTLYSFSLTDAEPIKFESNSPAYLWEVPHLVVTIKNYTFNGKLVPVLGSIDLLHKYYRNFISKVNLKLDESLKAMSLSLTGDKSSDLEKIKAIFYWVKDNIKYIAFEYGYEGYIPREASNVYEQKFGDCKDMSSIITCMAKYASIPNVHMCWIGTRDIPYSYKDLPTPLVDNHMIACFEFNDSTIFLDATDSHTRFGLPSSFIQGKEALIDQGNEYKIKKVPIVAAQENQTKETIKIKLENNTFYGNGILSMNGLTRTDAIYLIGDALERNRFELIKTLVEQGNNKFQLNKYSEENIENKDFPYIIHYDFKLEDYVVSVGNETFINLFTKKTLENGLVEQDREKSIVFKNLITNLLEVEMVVPVGQSVVTIPEEVSLNNALLKVNIKYIVEKSSVKLKSEIETKTLLLEKKDFELWNQSLKVLNEAYSKNIVLSSKK